MAENRKMERNGKRIRAKTAAATSVDFVHNRRNAPQDPVRPARYLNGVKLDEYEDHRAATQRTRLTLMD